MNLRPVRANTRLVMIDKNTWEIPKSYRMECVAQEEYMLMKHMEKMKGDRTLEQCVNLAHLQGIYKYAITLPDVMKATGSP